MSETLTERNIYNIIEDGRMCCKLGLHQDDNPFRKGSDEYDLWNEGWLDEYCCDYW
jgi:hypothetical protein